MRGSPPTPRRGRAAALSCAAAVLAVVTSPPDPGAAQTSLVPAHHPVYTWLYRQRVLGHAPSFVFERRPISRAAVAAHLRDVADSGASLGPGDAAHLASYLQEFTRDGLAASAALLGGAGSAARRLSGWWRNGREPHLVAHVDSAVAIAVDVWGGLGRTGGDEAGESFSTLTTEVGVRAFADFRGAVGIHVEAGRLAGRSDARAVRLDPLFDKTRRVVEEGAADSWYVETVASTRWGPLSLHAGHGSNRFGPGRTSSLLLSETAANFGWVRLDVDARRFRYSALHGRLPSDLEGGVRIFPGDTTATASGGNRWLAVHRFEWLPVDLFRIAFTELISYSARPADFAYLNPVAPLFLSELENEDRDNAVWSLDASVRPLPGLELFGSVFIDDLRSLGDLVGPGDEADVDRAFEVGATAALPLGLEGGVRRVRIEPWIYTHWQRLNALDIRGHALGHPLGPNATETRAWAGIVLPRRTRIQLSWARGKKGLNPLDAAGDVARNVGGDLVLGAEVQGDVGLFEGADVQEFRTLGVEGSIEPLRGVRLGVRWERRTRTAGSRLPERDFLDVRLTVGR